MTDFCCTQMNDKKTRRPVSDKEAGRFLSRALHVVYKIFRNV